MLTAKGYINTIEEPNPHAPVTDEAKYTTLYFLRHHLHPDLKNEYMMEVNPRAVWVALKERYDQQKGNHFARSKTRMVSTSSHGFQICCRI